MKIVSGGQTGVDGAALDTALELGLACGGWCPAGRWAEDGPIDARYPLRETPSDDPAQRTEWNVRDSDATLILPAGPLAGGTAFTRDCAEKIGRPFLVPNAGAGAEEAILGWLAEVRPARLNVAGPRESEAPGIHSSAKNLLHRVLAPRLRS